MRAMKFIPIYSALALLLLGELAAANSVALVFGTPTPSTITAGTDILVPVYLQDDSAGTLAANGLTFAAFDITPSGGGPFTFDGDGFTIDAAFAGGGGGVVPFSPSIDVTAIDALSSPVIFPNSGQIALGTLDVVVRLGSSSGNTIFTVVPDALGFQDGFGNSITVDSAGASISLSYTAPLNVAPLPATAEMGFGMLAFVGLLALRRRVGLKAGA